jgi:hypothetical protein
MEQRLRRTVFKNRAAAWEARPLQKEARSKEYYPQIAASFNASFLGLA